MIRTAKLGEVADVVAGVGFPKEMQGHEEGEIPVFKVGDISMAWLAGERVLRTSRNYLTGDHARRLGKQVPAGSTVFAKIGEALRLNRRAILGQPSLVDNNVMGVVPRTDALAPLYLFYFMQTVDLGKLARATAVPSVRKSDVVDIGIPLPSLSEQDRVVAEIEKQFSRLDEAVADLKRVKANLKRYKAAILKAAVQGRLVTTEADLASRLGRNYESGAALLSRVLEERRAKWGTGAKYKDAAAPACIEGAALPEGWTWASLEQLCTVFVDSAHRTPKYGDGTHPAIGPRDVVGGFLNLERVRLVSDSEYLIQVARHIPKPGDVVYSRELSLGWGAMLPAGANVCLSQGMCLFRPAESISAKYFLTVLNSPFVRRQAESLAAGSAHPHLNLSDIKALALPLPPLPEQDRIVGEVERLMTGLEGTESTAEQSLAHARALRQAIAAAAFRAVERVEVENGIVP